MNDRQVDIFLAAAESGSFSKAERQLYLSRQTIMKQIERLESEIGCTLFVRSPAGLSLTRAGELLREGLIPMRSQMQELLASCRRADELPARLRIEIPRHPVSILDDAIALFSKRYPDVKLEVVRATSKGRIDRMRSGQIDIADMPLRSDYDLTGLTYTHLVDYPYYCLLASGHPLAEKKRITAEDLRESTVYVHSLSARRPLIEDLLSRRPDILFREISGDEIDAILSICYSGNIYATPAHFATRLSQLTAIPLDSRVVQKIGLLSRNESNKAVDRFIETTLEILPVQSSN